MFIFSCSIHVSQASGFDWNWNWNLNWNHFINAADIFLRYRSRSVSNAAGGMRTAEVCQGWIVLDLGFRLGVGVDVQEQLHSPFGQAQELPQLQVHPGAVVPRECGVS